MHSFTLLFYSVFKILKSAQLTSDFIFDKVFARKLFTCLVGTSGLEPPTSRLSGVRSNHLSYAPIR